MQNEESKMQLLKTLHWLLSSQLGIDPQRLWNALRSMPWFFRSYLRFAQSHNGKVAVRPCFHDRNDQAGAATNEYFIQDLLAAQLVQKISPERHLDIGSRVDGFVAHIASFRDIDVMDVRPLSNVFERIRFLQHDLMSPLEPSSNRDLLNGFDSISCLHALEHFGLGRYGDPINVKGWSDGLKGISALLRTGGTFYLSTPVGVEKVFFNANWVFNPRSILSAAHSLNLKCNEIYEIVSGQPPVLIDATEEHLRRLESKSYTLCLFVFTKTDGYSNEQ